MTETETSPVDSKRVLFVTSRLDIGGAEVFLVDLVLRLMGLGMSCSVASLEGGKDLIERLERHECEVIGPPPKNGLWDKIKFTLSLRRIIREKKPDVVQGWMYGGNLAATLATLGLDVPVVWSVHHSLNDVQKRPFTARLALVTLFLFSGKPKEIHYCSPMSAVQHERYGFPESKRFVVCNGVDCQRFTPNPQMRPVVRAQMGLASLPDAPVVGHIGHYHPMKDHITFLCAAAFLASMHPDARFVLIGKGVDEKNKTLTALRETLGLSGRAFFLGERPNVDVLLNGMDLVSSSSAWGDMFPVALAEAMAMGIPCAATDIGDCAYLVGGTGVVVPPRDGDALGRAWARLLTESPEAREDRKKKARERILDNFDITSATMRFFTLYSGIT